MKKSNLRPTVVLGVICLMVALLLSAVNLITEDVITARRIEAVSKSLRVVMPDGDFDEPEKLPDDAPESVTGIYKDLGGRGHVVTLSTDKGYTGKPILITVGVDNDGKIIKAIVTETSESKITPDMEAYPDRFAGVDASKIDSVDTVGGVTYSSKAVKEAIRDALVVLGYAEPSVEQDDDAGVAGPVTRSDEEVYDLAMKLLPKADALEEVSFDGSDPTLIKAFKAKNGAGYVFYVATGSWGRLESEGLIATDNLGNITDINFLTWGVGHDVDCTEEYVESFKGKNKDALTRVELVAGATGTAEHFRDAVGKALDVAFDVPVYTVIAASAVAAAALAALICLIINKRRNNHK